MADREGHRLGNYRLARLLGKGAFAEVYLGEHLYLNTYAAIKVLLTSLTEKDEQVFLSEAQTLAELAHPNIVRVHDFAIERGIPFLVMDYAPAGTLRQRYPKGACLSLEQTVIYIKQVATALQYAHNHGIIHRDVKPENLLQSSQQVLLSDFGISLHLPSVQASNAQEWAGTLPYMAPEQLRGKAVYASDQYSLAIVAYEWLCGACPFAGNALSLAYQHAQVPPPPLREKDPSLPAAVERVILKALSKDLWDRYASVITFARVLERASREGQDEPVQNGHTEVLDAPSRSTPRQVFLSHARSENVSRLKTDLETRDLIVADLTLATATPPARSDPSPDHAEADGASADPVGERGISAAHEEAARQAIRASHLVLLVVTAHTRSSVEVKEHLRIAGLYRRPVLCVWAAGQPFPHLLPAGTEPAAVIDARGSRYDQALDEIMTHLERERRGASMVEHMSPEPAFEPRNPYKGLRAFIGQDRRDFFGREACIKEMLNLLRDTLLPATPGSPGKRLLTIVGKSGSGKSSIAMAGLLPQLQEGAIEGSEAWIYLDPLLPGRQPITALSVILATRFPEKGVQAVREVLGREGAFGLQQLALATAQQGARVVLLIDQLEEVFAPEVSEAERHHFINLLVAAATEPGGPLLLILTLRADFYDRPLAYPALGHLIQQGQCTVLPMEMEDLRAVIERPALQPDVRLVFEEDLVGDLLYEIRGQAAALPLLEFTLDQLFAHRRGHRLTRHAYQEIGGGRGALAKHAEDTYAQLPFEEHRRLTRAVFLRLIQPGATGQDPIHRRADHTEFTVEDEQQTTMLREIIQAFLSARLLSINQTGATHTLEVGHEALLREWPRLAEWTGEAGEEIRLQQSISQDAAEWEQHNKAGDRLYRGSQLKEAQAWSRRNIPSGSEVAFLRAGATQRMVSLVRTAVLMLLLLSTTGVLGWVFTRPGPTLVSHLADDNKPGSLRYAINQSPPKSTITFDASLSGKTILLTSGNLNIARDLTILGPAGNPVSISSGKSGYIVHVAKGVTVTFSNLTFKESTVPSAFLFNDGGTLRLNNCTVSGITAGSSGIYNGLFSTMMLTNSTVKDNISNGSGGGIANSGTLTMSNSTISGNRVMGRGTGGGIGNGGTLTVSNSTISGNTAPGAGGGIYNTQTLTLINSTISGNTAGVGGGIDNTVMLTVSNSTISGNTVTGPNSWGGGIHSAGILTLSNSTLAGNTAGGSGGGIFIGTVNASPAFFARANLTFSTIYGNSAPDGNDITIEDISVHYPAPQQVIPQSSQMQIRNSIVAANPAQAGPDIVGTLTSYGYNLFQDNSGASFDPATSGQHGTDRILPVNDFYRVFASPVGLRNNGGPTMTLALAPNSPVVDQVPLAACHVTVPITPMKDRLGTPIAQSPLITTDQRGMKRPDGGENTCDIGAYEYADTPT